MITSDGKCQFLSYFPADISRPLESNGALVLAKESAFWQIKANSRMSFLGCWLVMENINTPSDVTQSQPQSAHQVQRYYRFFFKDSFTLKGYARLRRIVTQIQRTKVSQKATATLE